VTKGCLKGTIVKHDKSSNGTSCEVMWYYTAFGISKVSEPQIIESLDCSDEDSDASDASGSYVPSVTSQAHSPEIHDLKDNTSNVSVGSQVPPILGDLPTRGDINLRACIKANYRRYL
jgi:hypothetical protein